MAFIGQLLIEKELVLIISSNEPELLKLFHFLIQNNRITISES